ncbi:MAG: outer membrane lipoprotein carrier protein LolA [Devosia sp.]|nr:outer membrane lipoprotein carrier protein LolA [Devosia sp.]
MIRRTFLALAALAFAAPSPAFAQEPRQLTEEETALIQDISSHNSAIRTMAGRFLQIDIQGNRIEGTFFIERPGKVRFRYNPPSREEIISVGRGFYVIDRKEQTQYAYPQDKVPLRQFLDSKIDLLAANIVAIDQSEDYLSLTLRDDTPAGVVTVSLVFDKETKDLVQWVLVDPSGAELTFSLYDVQKGVEIPKSYFYIDPTYRAIDPTS